MSNIIPLKKEEYIHPSQQQQRQPHKGLTGLENLGNTCFLNSCMQILAHTHAFEAIKQKYENQARIHHEKEDAYFLKEFEELRTLMRENEGVIRPEKFVRIVHSLAVKKNRPLFTGWMQNDVAEFLLFFIECVHNAVCFPVHIDIGGQVGSPKDVLALKCYAELKKVYEKEYSPFMEAFYGMYISQILTIEEPHTELSVKPEQFFILDLPIPVHGGGATHGLAIKKNITLYDCINAYCHGEILQGENAWYNDKTNAKQDVVKRIRFWSFPDVLVITLKRFTAHGEHKLQNYVDFPIKNLDLSSYVDGYHSSQYVYDLYGICNHMGGIQGGHYTAYVLHKDILGGVWLHHNDTAIDLVKEEHLVTPTAYCLFYQRRK